MTDWTPQDDWSQVKVGDQVRVMRAEQMLTGVVDFRYFSNSFNSDNVYAVALKVPDLADVLTIHHGYWQLSVPAKPAVELPTEPGYYLNTHSELAVRQINGSWRNDRDITIGPMEMEARAPYKKLEPVAVTAKKVIEFIESDLSCDSYDTARKEFGVTE